MNAMMKHPKNKVKQVHVILGNVAGMICDRFSRRKYPDPSVIAPQYTYVDNNRVARIHEVKKQ